MPRFHPRPRPHPHRAVRLALLLTCALPAVLPARGAAQSGPRSVEATSLFGEPLYRPEPAGEARTRMERQLAEARAAYNRAPSNPDSIIWLGRRLAYLGRYNEAIATFSDGVRRHPDDARMYRHRGHRYITVRRFADAIRDFEKAVTLVRGRPDEVEPDGQPNARNIPTSTLQSNIWYHLALAHYLSGDFEKALTAWREDMAVAKNPDMQVAVSHWLYMTLRRLDRDAEAARVLDPIRADMDIIENGSYHRLLLMYKGELPPDSLLKDFGAQGGLDDVTTAYGVANWHLYNERRAPALEILRRVVGARGQWAAFGYLASEADLRRLGGTPPPPPPSGTARP
ncbi:MAG TPA: tetratricopeptide repeat protein [Gemmatimonadaceae bacterium]|nr:tetratricopeptide repeat protein [Gemmatimonadaceae bacterium]